jgi:hypothetical protein
VAPLDEPWVSMESGHGHVFPVRDHLVRPERAELTARAHAGKISYRDVLRAKIILACAAGLSHAAIAAVLGICEDTVRKWRKRFAESGLAGLKDLPRPGRTPTFTQACVVFVHSDSSVDQLADDVSMASMTLGIRNHPDERMVQRQRVVIG